MKVRFVRSISGLQKVLKNEKAETARESHEQNYRLGDIVLMCYQILRTTVKSSKYQVKYERVQGRGKQMKII